MNKQIEICKTCKNQKFDFKTGIICGLTNQKPNFTDKCPDFISNKKQQIYFNLSEENLNFLKKELQKIQTPTLSKILIRNNKLKIGFDNFKFLVSLIIPIFILVFAYNYVREIIYVFLPLLFAPWLIVFIIIGFRKIIFDFEKSQIKIKNFGITTYKDDLKHITGITDFDKTAPRAINPDLKGTVLHYKISIKFLKEIKLGTIKVAGISFFRERDIKHYGILRTTIDNILSYTQKKEKKSNSDTEQNGKFGTNYNALNTLHKMSETDLKKLSDEELIELDKKSTQAIEDQNKLINEVLGLSPEQSKELDNIMDKSMKLKKMKTFDNFVIEYKKNTAILKTFNKNIELEEIVFGEKIIVTIENSAQFIEYLIPVYRERLNWLNDNKKKLKEQ